MPDAFRKVRLAWNITSGRISAPVLVYFKRGEKVTVIAVLTAANAAHSLDEGKTLVLTVKQRGKFDTDALVRIATFEETETPGTYEATVRIAGPLLDAALGVNGADVDDETEIAAFLDLAWVNGDDEREAESDNLPVVLRNNPGRDEDTTPSGQPSPDSFVAARAVLFDRLQTLTAPEQAQARGNIGAASIAALAAKLDATARASDADPSGASLAAAFSALALVYQPLDGDLTALAALTTTSYGRALLTLANQAALQSAVGIGTAGLLAVDTDTTLAANSDTRIASQKAVKAHVAAAVAALVNSSPSALDTLNELAAALGNDASFSATVMNALAGKESSQTAGSQAELEAGTVTTKRSWTPKILHDGIASLIASLGGGGGGTSFSEYGELQAIVPATAASGTMNIAALVAAMSSGAVDTTIGIYRNETLLATLTITGRTGENGGSGVSGTNVFYSAEFPEAMPAIFSDSASTFGTNLASAINLLSGVTASFDGSTYLTLSHDTPGASNSIRAACFNEPWITHCDIATAYGTDEQGVRSVTLKAAEPGKVHHLALVCITTEAGSSWLQSILIGWWDSGTETFYPGRRLTEPISGSIYNIQDIGFDGEEGAANWMNPPSGADLIAKMSDDEESGADATIGVKGFTL